MNSVCEAGFKHNLSVFGHPIISLPLYNESPNHSWKVGILLYKSHGWLRTLGRFLAQKPSYPHNGIQFLTLAFIFSTSFWYCSASTVVLKFVGLVFKILYYYSFINASCAFHLFSISRIILKITLAVVRLCKCHTN